MKDEIKEILDIVKKHYVLDEIQNNDIKRASKLLESKGVENE